MNVSRNVLTKTWGYDKMASNRNRKGEPMKRYTFRMPVPFMDQVSSKCERNLTDASKIVRRLLELWLKGHINLDDYKDVE